MEDLPLAVCKTILFNPRASPTPQEFEKILDSVTVHIQDSHIQVNAEEVAVIFDALKESIKSLFSKVGTLEKELKDLQIKYDDLQKKYQELEKPKSAFLIGQIASDFERKLLERILHGTDASPDYATFKKLEDAISGKSGRRRTGMRLTDKDKDIADANWKHWDRKLQLDNAFYASHGHLKKQRNFTTQPNLDRNKMHSCLAQLEAGKDKTQVEKMIKIIEELEDDNYQH